LSLIEKTLSLLSTREKHRGTLVLGLVVIMAALDTAGVASVMPFLGVLGNPQLVETNVILATVYDSLGFETVDGFLFALGASAFLLILFGAIFRTFTHYTMNRFIELSRHAIGERLLETYLRQPYAFFLNRHSGDLATSILSEVDQLVGNVFRPGILMIANTVVLLAIIVLLIAVDPVLAAVVAGVLAGLYGLMYVAVQGLLGRIGWARLKANKERFEAASEALGGIKDIKLLGRERAYLTRFSGPSLRHSRYQATNQTLSQVPRFLLEAVAFGGILSMALVLLALHDGAGNGALGQVLPILGLYAFAGYRMLPAAQYIYEGFARVRFGAAAVVGVYNDLRERANLAEIHERAPQAMRLRRCIALEHVSFKYPNTQLVALDDIHFNIPVGSSVGLVGSTGAGKTTLVDVILGLLRPTQGSIIVDGQAVTEDNLRAWQQALGYVPQDIFLTDTNVAENIALGVTPEEIDYDRVVKCARMAQVHDFITQELPEQYNSLVGERGVRLSGGQRQRIGIARALYHDPDVLVFDEATSALDMVTERAVMEAMDALSHQKTMILIAHRLSTVKNCDQIVVLEKGRVAMIGRYNDLERDNEQFRELARSSAAGMRPLN
jgi:ATP-binding cassette, subfamily B, bacterial PglK